MPLLLVDEAAFSLIKSQWEAQCNQYDEDIASYAEVSMEHAQNIVSNPVSKDYSIFSAVVDGSHECILHVNRARLPRTDGVTQKVMWVLLAPKYDFDDISPNDVAKIATEVVNGAIELCKDEGRSAHIKIHMGNFADRGFFGGIAYNLRSSGTLAEVEIRGNWLHMTLA
jgi:hypothetical protein